MTVNESFQEFKSSLELSDRTQDQAALAQQRIREGVAAYLHVPDSFLSGSYSRYTKIYPLNDIDVMLVRNVQPVQLATDGKGISPNTALEQLMAAVRKAYPGSANISKQSRSVNVQLNGLKFGFDLVPAWARYPDGYWIPDTDTNSWLPTDPKAHARLMTQVNQRCSDMLKPVIKMMKHWSRNNLDLIRSFHMELICADILLKNTWDSFQMGVGNVLFYLRNYVGQQMMDPIYAASRVDKPLSAEDAMRLITRINTDTASAVDALRLEAAGNHENALSKWKAIFLTGFPK